MAVTVNERPPLELGVEVGTPGGATVRLHSGATDPGMRPRGIGFRTARYDGFKDAGFTLHRRIDQTYPDLALFNTLRFIGAGGDIAYEGRMAALPRSTGSPPTWTVQAAGLMANARDRKFSMPFVDRAVSQWSGMPFNERVRLAGAGISFGDFSWAVGDGGIVVALPNQALGAETGAQSWYTTPPGCNIAMIGYTGTDLSIPAGWTSGRFVFADTDALTASETQTATLDGTVRYATATRPYPYALTSIYSSGTAATPAAGANRRFGRIAVYGDHGLQTYPITDEPAGVLASDVITWLIENYCPQLNAGGVLATSYPIAHVSFNDRTHPYDAFLTVNSFHRWGLECWEGGTVHFAPLDLTDYDWELRLDDFGTQLDVSGAVAEEVANGIEVTYTDAQDGQTRTLLPDDYTDLQDTNPLNSVNRAGLYRPTDYTINSPATLDMALQIGRMALAEFNRPKHKGTATRQGYIKDRAGAWQPVWKVRAGQRVLITDSVDEEVHVVHETDYQHDGSTVRIAVDDTFQQLDAYLDRYANAVQARGI